MRNEIECKILPNVQKPMRYMGGELNCIVKDLLNVNVHGVFCFPDLYDIGMSHFGLQILYHIVNKYGNWALSRAFHPWVDAEKIMRENHIPLYSLEYFTPVKDADWIGFTVQYELQYTNVVNMLDLAGISVLQNERSDKEPIVIAGGPCVSNPEPLSKFIDAFAIGDGEELVVTICNILEKKKKNNFSKKWALEELAKVNGIYIPSFHEYKKDTYFSVPDTSEKTKAAKIGNLNSDNYPSKNVVPLMEVVHHRLSVEVMRGCTRGCRFCSAGTYYRPVRERDPVAIMDSIKTGMNGTGWKDIGLLSLSTADYSSLSNLLHLCAQFNKEEHASLSLPSTRVDALSEEQLKLLHSVSPISSITIAPEAGSMRLRKIINKDFTDEQIFLTVDKLLANNIQTLKLYFMIGLPYETEDDIDSIISLVTKIAGKVRAVSKKRMVNVAISPFSPKPHTPFQREAMESIESLLEKGKYIKQSLKNLKNVKVSYRNPQVTFLETVMARGDKSIGTLIYKAWKNGAKFDGWDEFFNLERWTETAENEKVDLQKFTNSIDDDIVLPWQMVSTGVSEKFLIEERDNARKQITTKDCRTDACINCGVCGNDLKPVISTCTDIPDENSSQSVSSKSENSSSNRFYYRVYFDKNDNLRFLGHMDMVNIIHRAFAIGKIPLAFSQGFSRHARISFGPPLPLGVAGKGEAFDIELTEPISSNLYTLNKWLPNGLSIISYKQIDQKSPSLNSVIKAARYTFTPINENLMSDIEEKIKNILSKDVINIEYFKNEQKHIKDIRKGIIEMSNSDDKTFQALLAIEQGLTCKPSELIITAFHDKVISDFIVRRVNCYQKNSTGFLII